MNLIAIESLTLHLWMLSWRPPGLIPAGGDGGEGMVQTHPLLALEMVKAIKSLYNCWRSAEKLYMLVNDRFTSIVGHGGSHLVSRLRRLFALSVFCARAHVYSALKLKQFTILIQLSFQQAKSCIIKLMALRVLLVLAESHDD